MPTKVKKTKKTKKPIKQTGFSPLLGIAILIVVAVLITNLWLVFYFNSLYNLATESMSQSKQQLVKIAKTQGSDKESKNIFNISGTISEIGEDYLQIVANSPALSSSPQKVKINLSLSTEFYQLDMNPTRSVSPNELTINKNQLKTNDRINVYTIEKIDEIKPIVARKIVLLP